MLNSKVIFGLSILSLLLTICVSKHSIRSLDAVPANSLSRFPHHVVIRTAIHVCSGSIVTDQWILTSLRCVKNETQFGIEFKRLDLNSSNFEFSAELIEPELHRYPTEWDDIVLIKLPFKLIFDDELNKIPVVKKTDAEISNKFVTMPAFNKNQSDSFLTSNMFHITERSVCKKAFGADFDEMLHICAEEWKHYKNKACSSDLGAGLLLNWPHNTQLIGIFSAPQLCDTENHKLAVFTNVAIYMNWIDEIVGSINDNPNPKPRVPVTKPKTKPRKLINGA